MKDNIHLETNFEKYISSKLVQLSTDKNAWRISKNDNGFDPQTALCIDDFIEYQNSINPEKIQKMQDKNPASWKSNLTRKLVESLEKNGTIATLRNGFSMAGYQNIICSGHYPDDPRLPKLKEQYDANILRVMHQVHYQTAGNKSLDLVFFINGIPVATAEVKTELTQTVQDAIEEYQKERRPEEPGSKRRNYLLMYKRGAVVHFAISEDEIWMCTNLTPAKPKFLPFNMGNNGHAGNPKSEDVNEYPTGYFWNQILQRDNWLKIFHNFIYEEVKRKPTATGRIKEQRTQIFPRFHQWDCVTKCIEDVKTNGAGQRYLIEHSAGSGKTSTISWISHELIRLMDNSGNRLFSSVIVVTDRTVLDSNIKATIKQLKKTSGLIEMIGGDEKTKTSGAKSKALAKALKEKREIIVVTLQTFPYALEAISSDENLTGCNFAVLIDEAHSAQGGNYSAKMKAALKLASKEKKKDNDNSTPTDEEVINAYFKEQQANRVMPSNVSFFAFTATPKAETKTLFGRPGTQIDEKTNQPIPESFHLYPMRQAIEEGYILDVLKGYMPYKTAYKLKEDLLPNTMVDERTAIKTIAKWANLHPTNVMSKAEIIIEHFMKNVSDMLDNQAKAMIVTSSRAAVIRYKYAIEAYLSAHPEYDRNRVSEHLQFKVPGEPLVAFSGKVEGKDAIMLEDEEIVSEHDYLKENPFALIKRDYEYTEENMNNLGSQTIESAFDNNRKNRFLIVADKFQTGFDQPKLCALYIDKTISNDIEIVQTYSRLNRTYAGKDHVFILDFCNKPETVVRAFKKYDTGAEMEHAQNLDIIYDIKNALDDAGIYTQDEFETFTIEKYKAIANIDNDKSTYRTRLYNCLNEPATRWLDAYKTQQNAYIVWSSYKEKAQSNKDKDKVQQADVKLAEIQEEQDKLAEFKAKLKKFCSAYSYISQIIDLEDPSLEVFYSFAKLLAKRIGNVALDDIDVRVLVMSDYRINKTDTPENEPENAKLKPMGAGGKGKASQKESLKEIIARINEIWGSDVDVTVGARTLNALADYVAADDVSRIQIRNTRNSKKAVIAEGRLEGVIKAAALSLKQNDFADLADRIINDPQSWEPLADVIFDLINDKKRVDIPDVVNYVRKK